MQVSRGRESTAPGVRPGVRFDRSTGRRYRRCRYDLVLILQCDDALPSRRGLKQECPMTTPRDKALAPGLIGPLTIDAAIRIGLFGLLLYWSLKVIGPFLSIALWSAILTVALYPLYEWLARQLRSRRVAAAVITILCLMIVVGPVTWLGMGLISTIEFAVRGLDTN